MSKAWSGGSTRAWRRVRRAVLDANRLANGGRCALRVVGVCTGVATQAHHTLGRTRTGDDPAYLVATCAACNQHIGEPTTVRVYNPEPRTMTRWATTDASP